MHALARSARSLGYEVTIVAPNFDASGTGASLGPLSRKEDIVYETHEIPDFDGEAYSINGPPALCVIVSHLEAFGSVPDFLTSILPWFFINFEALEIAFLHFNDFKIDLSFTIILSRICGVGLNTLNNSLAFLPFLIENKISKLISNINYLKQSIYFCVSKFKLFLERISVKITQHDDGWRKPIVCRRAHAPSRGQHRFSGKIWRVP